MDRISKAILGKITSASAMGRYVIITEDEFFEVFPEDCEKTYEALEKAVTSLSKNGYIDVKYSRGDVYCIAWLREYIEEVPKQPEVPPKFNGFDRTFISAFVGGALGSLIVSLVFAFV